MDRAESHQGENAVMAVAMLTMLQGIAEDHPDIVVMDEQGISIDLYVADTGGPLIEVTHGGGTETFSLTAHDLEAARVTVDETLMARGYDEDLTDRYGLPVPDDRVTAYVATGYGAQLRRMLNEFIADVQVRLGSVGQMNPRHRAPIVA